MGVDRGWMNNSVVSVKIDVMEDNRCCIVTSTSSLSPWGTHVPVVYVHGFLSSLPHQTLFLEKPLIM